MPDPVQVQSMFARISGRYDLLNRVLSAGIDQRWRKFTVRKTIELLGEGSDLSGRTIVDACCGTGDLSALYERAGARVLGVDFTREMLVHALPKRRENRAVFAHGDALALPLTDDSADACSVAFGLRNTADRILGLREMARVVRPGGWVLVLEFTTPPGKFFGGVYTTYFTKLLPRVGKLISKDDSAYNYLPETVLAWPKAPALRDEMVATGLLDCDFRYLTRGIAALHWGRVPRSDSSSFEPRQPSAQGGM